MYLCDKVITFYSLLKSDISHNGIDLKSYAG